MTQLSKLAILGLAKEATAGTYVAPTIYVPFTKADWEDTIAEIKDESYRANDTTLQGLYAGVTDATWSIDVMSYPALVGHFLRGMIGPDTVVAGVSTTLAANSAIGATTISSTASIAATTYIQIDTSTAQEFAQVTAVTGTGPYTLTVTGAGSAGGLINAHTSGAAILAQTSHTFKQAATPIPSYSLTVFDTLTTLGYVGGKLSDFQIKIDPKNAVTLTCSYMTFPGTPQSTPTPAYPVFAPALGWQWNMTNAGAASTRGLTYDVTVKRATEAIHSSDGIQAPREIFSGTIDADGTYKAIFENQTDLNLFAQFSQQPATATMVQPVAAGACSLAITMSKSGWYKGKRDLSTSYVQADYSISGIYNTTDGGAVSAVLLNYISTAY